MFYNCEHESEYKCCNFRTESAFTQNVAKATNTKATVHDVVKTNIKCSTGITAEKKKKDLLTLYSKGYIPKNHHNFFQSLPVVSSERNNDIPQLVDEGNSEN